MIRIKGIHTSAHSGGLIQTEAQLLATSDEDVANLVLISKENFELRPFIKMAADHIRGRHDRPWEPGCRLECVSDEWATSLTEGHIYTFSGFSKKGKVMLREFGKVEFEASRFVPAKATVTVNSLSAPVSTQTLMGISEALGLKFDSGKKTVIEDKTSDNIYIHGKTNKPKGIPPRRARQGRKLIP